MHDILRNRIMRKLGALPEERLYQVLDYIEFLESKYAPGRAGRADGLQRFAEKLEDSMRMRNVAPKVISGTVGAVGTARRVLLDVAGAGREIGRTIMGETPPGETRPAAVDRDEGPSGGTTGGTSS
ncbi:MAG TPA: hypothetical protein VMM79_17195 [Longimicrobiales bacterium]|nr:hypothetical protein [Longimicrobiales bacterium]